jgi:hypothetical protein
MIDTVVEQPQAPEPEPSPPGRAAVLGGLAVATGLGAVTAVWEAFLTPVSAHTTRIPVALVLAVVGNAALVWFTREVTGRLALGVLPAGAWVAVMFLAAGQTTERDLILTSNNWVGLATMFAGALTFAITGYWFAIRKPLRSTASAR